MKKIYALLVLALFAFQATAQAPLLVEHFNYPADSLLQNNGWFSHSAGTTNPLRVRNGGLSWTQTPYLGSGIGNAVAVNNTGSDENRPFSSSVTSGNVYMSFLMRVNGTVTSTNAGFFLHTGDYANLSAPVFTAVTTAFRARTFIAPAPTTAQYKLGLEFNLATTTNTTATNLDTGVTYLVVVKYQFVPGANNDSVSLYVFADGSNIATEPAVAAIGPLAGTAADAAALQYIALRQYNATQNITIDGIIVQTAWNLIPRPAQTSLPITWDDPNIGYVFTDFGGNASALAPSPTDSTNQTLRTEKTAGAQTWAGTTITPGSGLAAPIPFAAGATTMTVKVHAPASGIPVRLKAETAGNPTISVETEATTTSSGWQNLVFNFANQATGTAAINFANTYNMLSIFYGFGSAGTGAIFYADSVFFGGNAGTPPPPPASVNLPITWDNTALTYSFTDFGGNVSVLAPSPTDSTNRTLRTEKTAGAQTWAGTTITPTTGLPTPIPFAVGATSIAVKVFSPAAGVIVRLKAEQAGQPTISVETEDTTSMVGWETLVFNFSNQSAGTAPLNLANTYNVLSIFYGFGTVGSGTVFFADSVFFGGGPVVPPPPVINLPITWDDLTLNYVFTDFGGNASTLAPSPTDSTNRTLRTEKTTGAQTWAGTTITPSTGLTGPIPFAVGATHISVKVFSPAAGTIVRLKAEQAGVPTVSVETEDTTTVAGWETLVFNFANPAAGTAQLNIANTYNVLSIFYGFGTAGTGTVFFADSVFFGGGPVVPPTPAINLPITWDNQALTYSFTDFGGNASALAPSPTDTTNRTLRTEKTPGAQTWAGTTITPAIGLGTPIPFAAGATSMTVKVHAPASGIIVRLKAEQAGVPTISVETEATTTTAGWQNLVFNFANQATGTAPINFANTYNMLSIFYGFGSAGTGAIFYADSVSFGGAPVGPPPVAVNLPITWDNPNIPYSFTDFGGNISAFAPSPTDTTNRTLRSEKTAGAQTWAGTTITPLIGLGTPIPFAANATTMTVKVHAPAAGVVVRLKAEQAGVPTISVETEATTTTTGWQNLVFNFANQATGTAPLNLANTYNLLSIFYDFGNAGTGAIFYADSVFFGGNPVTPPQLVAVTFRVDMSRENISANGVHIAGSFQGWNPSATPMTHQGNGIYTHTAQLAASSTYEFKFINGNQWGPGFDETVPSSCAQNNNRFVVVGTTAVTTPLVCFGRCEACGVSVFEQNAFNQAIQLYPNPAQNAAFISYNFETPSELSLYVYDLKGQLIAERHENDVLQGNVELNTSTWANGLYYVRISNGQQQVARKLVVNK